MAAASIAAFSCVITPSPGFAVDQFIASGKLVTLLEDYPLELMPIHAVYPHRQHLSPKITLLTKPLMDLFNGLPVSQ